MSTNDTVLLLSSGASRAEPLTGQALTTFQETLTDLCIELAKQIPDDGEGASHLICIRVSGCQDTAEAKLIAKSVASSNLVKTAIAGHDPNWGRIVSAAGYAGVDFDPRQLRLAINQHVVYEKGTPTSVDEATVSASIAASREATIELQFAEGSASACFWTSDLNVEYVRFNADYHT